MNIAKTVLLLSVSALLAISGTGCDWLFEGSDVFENTYDVVGEPDSLVVPPGVDVVGTADTSFTPPEGVTLPEVQVPQTGSLPELVTAYQTAAGQVLSSNKDFIEAYQVFAMADTSDVATFIEKTKAVNAAGDQWLVSVLTLNGYAKQFAGYKGDSMGKADGPILTVPGVPVTLPFNVGQLIGTTKEKIAKLEKAHDEGRIDDDQYYQAVNELKKTQTLDAVGTGLAAGSTVAGGFVVKAGLVLAGASGGVLVGGTILGAAAIGLGVKFLWSYCSGGKSDSVDGGYCTMQTHEGKVGEVVPLQFPGKGTLIIQVEGKEPIVIEDFGVDGGQVVVVDFEPGDPNTGTPPGPPTVTPADPSQFGTCEQVSGVSATPNPVDPGPGEGVTVTASTIPPIPGCTINFSIVGTDGYTKSESPLSDATGTASFYIPGGAEGVVDNVTISVGSHTTTVVYTF